MYCYMNNSFQNTLLVLELWGLDGLLLNRTSVFVALLLRKLGRDTEKKEKRMKMRKHNT